MSDPIYHITSRTSWFAAQEAGAYRADSLQSEGFIHCSKADQVLRVANAFYAGQAGLVLLVVDTGRLRSEVRWEPGRDKPDELFPHVYGLIDLDAVMRVLDFPPDADGKWRSLPV
jgi:uncharacterized protein (DUF952 family)